MKRKIITVVFTATAIMSGSALADANLELAKAKRCVSCHSMTGTATNDVPSFQGIAEKYKDRKEYDGMLISQIMGTAPRNSYHWGTRVMPTPGARPTVTVAEANQLLDWILSQKKK